MYFSSISVSFHPSILPAQISQSKQKWVCQMLLNNVMQESLAPTVLPTSGAVETAAAHFHHWSKAWAWAPGGQVAIPARASGNITVSQLFPPFAYSKITELNPTVLFCAFLRKPRWALKVCLNHSRHSSPLKATNASSAKLPSAMISCMTEINLAGPTHILLLANVPCPNCQSLNMPILLPGSWSVCRPLNPASVCLLNHVLLSKHQ